MNRQWRPIPGFDRLYAVSDDGIISESDSEGLGWPNSDYNEYVTLTREGLSARYSRESIVALVWLGPMPVGHTIVRLEGKMNRPTKYNMVYVTSSDPRCPRRDSSLDEYEHVGEEPVVRQHGSCDSNLYVNGWEDYLR